MNFNEQLITKYINELLYIRSKQQIAGNTEGMQIRAIKFGESCTETIQQHDKRRYNEFL